MQKLYYKFDYPNGWDNNIRKSDVKIIFKNEFDSTFHEVTRTETGDWIVYGGSWITNKIPGYLEIEYQAWMREKKLKRITHE